MRQASSRVDEKEEVLTLQEARAFVREEVPVQIKPQILSQTHNYFLAGDKGALHLDTEVLHLEKIILLEKGTLRVHIDSELLHALIDCLHDKADLFGGGCWTFSSHTKVHPVHHRQLVPT